MIQKLIFFALLLFLFGFHSQAQWSTTGADVHLTNNANNVSIGETMVSSGKLGITTAGLHVSMKNNNQLFGIHVDDVGRMTFNQNSVLANPLMILDDDVDLITVPVQGSGGLLLNGDGSGRLGMTLVNLSSFHEIYDNPLDSNSLNVSSISGKVRIRTNDESRITVTPNGKIGLNVEEPESILHIGLGNVRMTDEWDVEWYDGNLRTGRVGIDNGSMVMEASENANSDVRLIANDLVQLRTDGFPRLTVAKNGYTGIGTSLPKSKLHVAFGDISLSKFWDIKWKDDNDDVGKIATFGDHSLEIEFNEPGSDIIIDADDEVRLETDDETRLIVKQDGNIGIGTNIPQADLHIVGDVVLDQPGSAYVGLSGLTDEQRMYFSTHQSPKFASAFFELWGDETHGSGLADPTRAGEFNIECHTFKIGTDKPLGGLAADVDFEIKANGEVHCYGDLFAHTLYATSDRRLKKDIVDFTLGLDELHQLNPKQYFYTGEGGTPTGSLHTGLIAQEVAEVLPDAVTTFTHRDVNNAFAEEEFLAVNEGMIKFVLINSVKELAEKNTSLEAEVDELKNEIKSLRNQDVARLEAMIYNLQAQMNGLIKE